MSALPCGPGGLGLRARYTVAPQLHEEVARRLAAAWGASGGSRSAQPGGDVVRRAVAEALGAAVLASIASDYKRAYRRAVRACWQRWSADLTRHGHGPAAPAVAAGVSALSRRRQGRRDLRVHLEDLVSGWSYAAAVLLAPQQELRR